MTQKFKILFISLTTILLVSCDPIHDIGFVNKTSEDVKVRIHLDSKIENQDLESVANGDTIVLIIKEKMGANISFGIGSWSTNEIEKAVNSIKNIEIETSDLKTTYKSKNSIRKLLESNINGIVLKTEIEIEIK